MKTKVNYKLLNGWVKDSYDTWWKLADVQVLHIESDNYMEYPSGKREDKYWIEGYTNNSQLDRGLHIDLSAKTEEEAKFQLDEFMQLALWID